MAERPSLAEVYRRFAAVEAAASPRYERTAIAMSGSEAALRAIEQAPARKRQPALILAALHDLVLAGTAPELATAYAAGDADAAAAAAIDTLVRMTDAVVAIASRRRTQSLDPQRGAVLYPAIAEAARRAGSAAIGLIDVGGSTGLNLHVDRVAITYDDGRTLGDPSSMVHVTSTARGERPIPARPLPEVVARIAVGADPFDVTDDHDVRWLRACVWPDQHECRAQLDAALAVAASAPSRVVRGDPVALVSDAIALVPPSALPVVTTTWALSDLRRERRHAFVDELGRLGAQRPVALVSVEGVGVAPAVPTLGDRPASGHSIVGLAMSDGAAVRAEAIGRCWSRGRWLSWFPG